MIDLFREAAALQSLLENEGKSFYFPGGIANLKLLKEQYYRP